MRKIVILVTALAVGLAWLVSGAPKASAATPCEIISATLTPSTSLIENENYLEAKWVVKTSGDCYYLILLGGGFPFSQSEPGTWEIGLNTGLAPEYGVVQDRVEVGGEGWEPGDYYSLPTYTLLMRTRAKMAASPNPVVRGKTLTLRGTVTTGGDIDMASVGEQPMILQFRTSLTHGWSSVKTVQSTYTGIDDHDQMTPNVNTTIVPSEPGYWRWAYAGDSQRTAVVSNDVFVDVTNTPPAPSTKPPTAPRALKVSSSSTSAKLSWTVPASNGGAAISGYQVTGPKTASISAAGRSYTYSGLKPLRTYRLSVRAKNVKGWSAWSGVTVTTKARSPKAYKNCAALNADYPHGVGKSGAKDKGSGVTNFHRSNTTYAMNDGRNKKKKQYDLDRDNDKIACEKR